MPETLRGYRNLLAGVRAGVGRLPADRAGPAELERAAERPGWSATTRADALTVVRTAYRWAVRVGVLAADPTARVRIPRKASRGDAVTLTADQFARLLAAAAPAVRPILRALYLTGARPSELARATAADVKGGVITLSAHKTARRTGRPRFIVLGPEAAALFTRLAKERPDGPLFLNRRGRPWTHLAVADAVRAAREKAGLPHAIPYGFRHTFATDVLSSQPRLSFTFGLELSVVGLEALFDRCP